ncbi:MAG: 3'-5' exonuclease, partial [Comamonas sp.]
HFTRFNGKPNLTTKMVQYQAEVVDAAERVWVRMCDPDDPFPTVHDCYLKLYQLSMPDLSLQYKRILFDEAQDANPVTSQIVLSQSCKLTLVGDEHQQIFRYRGAVNALDHPLLNDVPRLYLTNSFRFGPNVAIVANALLELKGETVPVVGRGQADTVTLHVPMGTEHRCLVSRTVMGVLESALAAAARGESIFWVGGIENYKVQDLLDLHHFSRGELGNVKNKKLKADYKDYEEYKEAAEQTKDHEMQRSVRILETYAAEDIPAMIDHLKSLTVEEEMEASITVTTAHRSKGLEWDTVQLTDDYPDIFDPDMEPEAREDEINLLYVGSSRAMRVLIINAIIEIILNQVAQRRRARAKIEMVTA